MITETTTYTITTSPDLDDPKWDAFLAATRGGNYAQSSLWARVKSTLGYRVARITASYGNSTLGGAQILIRPFAFIGAVGYVPWGPVVAPEHSRLGGPLIEELHRYARGARIRFLAVQPPPGGESLADDLVSRGFCPTSTALAPTATVLIHLARDIDRVLKGMRKTTRYDIRAGERKGVVVREGTDGDISTFYRLHLAIAKRKDYSPYPEVYYRNLWRLLAPTGHAKLFLAEVEGESVSAHMAIAFGDTVTFWKNGWSGTYSGHKPNEAVQWAAIKWANSQGYRYYDLGGIARSAAALVQRGDPLPDLPAYKTYEFKLRFGGEVALFPEPYAYFYNRFLRWAYTRIYPRIWSWRAIHTGARLLR